MDSSDVEIRDSKNEETCVLKRSDSKFEVIHRKGDLFSCDDTESLAHCVSKDLNMGKGIATLFKKRFGRVTELKEQGKDVGNMAVLKDGKRFVYYLITKPRYFHKPSYKTLEQSLQAMKSHCVQNNVESICMPRIGCGLDRLEWNKVENMLNRLFQDTSIAITVYSL